MIFSFVLVPKHQNSGAPNVPDCFTNKNMILNLELMLARCVCEYIWHEVTSNCVTLHPSPASSSFSLSQHWKHCNIAKLENIAILPNCPQLFKVFHYKCKLSRLSYIALPSPYSQIYVNDETAMLSCLSCGWVLWVCQIGKAECEQVISQAVTAVSKVYQYIRAVVT